MTIEQLKQLVEKLNADPTQVTADELTAAREAIRALSADAKGQEPSEENIALLETLVAAKSAIDAETAARAEAAAEKAAKTAELLSELDREPETEAAEVTDEAADPAAGDATADAEQVVETEQAEVVDITPTETEQEPVAVAASGNTNPAPQGRTGRPSGTTQATPPVARETAVGRVRAAGSGGSFTHGQELTSTAQLARQFADRLRGAGAGRGADGMREYIARVDIEFPESRMLRPDDFDGNFSKIEKVSGNNALVAAGGLCAPLETLYDVEVVGSTDRPLRDALARFGVDRGGIQYRPASSAAAAVNGAGIWTMDNDEAADDPDDSGAPSKACYVVDCPAVEEAVIDAVYLCLEFGNITARFDPESTAANVQEGLIAHARTAENALYNKIAAGSKLIYGTQQLGATRDILGYIDRSVAYYRNRHRLTDRINLTHVMPAWVKELVRADLARQMPAGEWMGALGVTEAQINAFFAARNVTPVWFLDGSTADATVNGQTVPRQTYDVVAAGGAVPPFPTKIDSLLFVSGSWLFLDGGSLDLGLVRDSSLNSRNRYRQFSESFEGVADRGVESLRVLMPVKAIGSATGTEALDVQD